MFNVFKIGLALVFLGLRENLLVFVDPQTTTFGYFFATFVHQVLFEVPLSCQQGHHIITTVLRPPEEEMLEKVDWKPLGQNTTNPKIVSFSSQKKIDANFFSESYS